MATLKLSNFRPNLKLKLQKGNWVGDLRSITKIDDKYFLRYGYELDFDVYLSSKDKNLQRGYVWTMEQKRELIMSIIKGITIPNATALLRENRNGVKKYLVIDGKQRLSTLAQFVSDEFTIFLQGEEYFCSQLPNDSNINESILHTVLSHSLNFDVAYDYWDDMLTDDQLVTWFETINFAGTPQDTEHLRSLKINS